MSAIKNVGHKITLIRHQNNISTNHQPSLGHQSDHHSCKSQPQSRHRQKPQSRNAGQEPAPKSSPSRRVSCPACSKSSPPQAEQVSGKVEVAINSWVEVA